MTINRQQVKKYLQQFDFSRLFTQELGWDNHKATLTITIDKQTFNLHAAAEKRGMSAFVLEGDIPNYSTRLKIDRQVAKSAHEHLIIYADSEHTTQIWQWAKREPGKPVVYRESPYYNTQSGEALVQRVVLLSVTLKEEEEQDITTIDIADRAKAAFDIDKVTKRFYDQFKIEHKDFLNFVKGIPDEDMQRWYVSVMVNRLMFVYFIQKKGFLDGNPNYLKDKLDVMSSKGKDKYYSNFLCPLFFSGFAKKEEERSAKTNKLLGKVPYLNGGIFQKHQIEQLHGKSIKIPNCAFMALFEFFDQYKWHLDERPLREGKEINPDVLGYIFEKYINQKQMGAYYTKEDITGYISKNTIVPFIFDAAKKNCKIAFEGEQSVWRELRLNPDRYFYDAVKHGIIVNARVTPSVPLDKPYELPPDIAAGIDDVPKRTNWNKLAPSEYGLPTEIWREVVARRQRYEEIHGTLTNGEVTDINDLITYNLDITRFALDVIANSEGPELIRAIWEALEKITVLDPTCGSGAFLFAALNTLKPLYEACLNRMQVFLDESEQSGDEQKHEKYNDFRKIIARIDDHPNREYFILKSIILNNLYGVDIMDEAIEICKLRLFLKLVAQIDNLKYLEPLPDIDFNIRAGNTLVGYASFDDVQRSAELDIIKKQSLPAIKEKAEITSEAFEKFHKLQIEDEQSASNYVAVKKDLEEKLSELEIGLNKFLADDYHANTSANPKKLAAWIKSHKPFHWCVDFYSIIRSGGFDVIIGNPPYVELSNIANLYSLQNTPLTETGNLFAVCVGRFEKLVCFNGMMGVIVPISSVSTIRMLPLMQLLSDKFSPLHLSNFAVRPGKLFVGVDMNLSIIVGRKAKKNSDPVIFSTAYNRWYKQARVALFEVLAYAPARLEISKCSVPKLGSLTAWTIINKIASHGDLARKRSGGIDPERVYCHSGGRYYRKCLRKQISREYKEILVRNGMGSGVICVLSSSFYYWIWIAISDCYHVTKRDVDVVPVPESLFTDTEVKVLADKLLKDLWKHSQKRIRNRADGTQQEEINFIVSESKHIIDEIDRVLGKHYGFTDEELDFIINYDIKYRLGLGKSIDDGKL